MANDNFKDGSLKQATREWIDVKDIPAISKLKLSYSGQEAGLSKAAYRKAMVNGLKNLRGRHLKDVPAQNIVINCAKAGWHKNGNVTVV